MTIMKKKYLPITYSLLKSNGACSSGLELFKKHVGLERAIPLTKKTIEKFSSIFDIEWAAYKLLDKEYYMEYEKVTDTALAECEKVRGPAWKEYEKIRDTAFEKFEKVTGFTWAEYYKVRDTAYATFEKAIGPTSEEYHKIRGTEFVRLYKLGMSMK